VPALPRGLREELGGRARGLTVVALDDQLDTHAGIVGAVTFP